MSAALVSTAVANRLSEQGVDPQLPETRPVESPAGLFVPVPGVLGELSVDVTDGPRIVLPEIFGVLALDTDQASLVSVAVEDGGVERGPSSEVLGGRRCPLELER